MNKDFPRILTFLRKEKKLSQKEAAAALGISQALLSHYEKGIRECGLDFVVRAADFYNVSSDYLLGRTPEREYVISETAPDRESKKQSAAQIINRRMMADMLNVIYDFSAAAKNRRLDRTVTNYFFMDLYKVFRLLYSANPDNAQELFTVPGALCEGYADAVMKKHFTDIRSMAEKDSPGYLSALGEIDASPDTLAEEYPEATGSLFNIIQQAENQIQKLKI